MSDKVYIARIGDVKYNVYAVGRTEDEARECAARELIATDNCGYGLSCDPTLGAVLEWYSPSVYGPVDVPGAVTE